MNPKKRTDWDSKTKAEPTSRQRAGGHHPSTAADRPLTIRVTEVLRELNLTRNVRVTVRDGVVAVRGEVRNLLVANRVVRRLRRVPNVKGVVSMLTTVKRFTRRDSPLRLIAERRQAMQNEMQRLIETMTPAAAVPLPPQVLQAQRNAAARHLLITEFGGLTSADIGQVAGSKSSNRAALAHRWKSDGRIFAVMHQGTPTFPGFQFSPEGQPLPVIASLLAILGDTHSGWELALWFLGSNGWLDGQRPVDLLLTEPDRVIAAAKHEAEAFVF